MAVEVLNTDNELFSPLRHYRFHYEVAVLETQTALQIVENMVGAAGLEPATLSLEG